MPYKHNEPRRHTIPNAKYKVGRWREYNRALRQRGRLTVWVSSEALATWTPVQTGRRGWSLAYSDLAIETGSCCAWRWAGVLSGWRGRIAHGKLVGMSTTPDPYRGFRFPAAIISEAVWLYHGFSLSLREVELILAARGIEVSDETIREWGLRFGREFANTLKRRRPKSGDTWLLDEVFIRIRGKPHYLWRAINQNGVVLDILVQSRRNTKAAKRFLICPRVGIAVGNAITGVPPHRSVRAAFPHTAPTSGV